MKTKKTIEKQIYYIKHNYSNPSKFTNKRLDNKCSHTIGFRRRAIATFVRRRGNRHRLIKRLRTRIDIQTERLQNKIGTTEECDKAEKHRSGGVSNEFRDGNKHLSSGPAASMATHTSAAAGSKWIGDGGGVEGNAWVDNGGAAGDSKRVDDGDRIHIDTTKDYDNNEDYSNGGEEVPDLGEVVAASPGILTSRRQTWKTNARALPVQAGPRILRSRHVVRSPLCLGAAGRCERAGDGGAVGRSERNHSGGATEPSECDDDRGAAGDDDGSNGDGQEGGGAEVRARTESGKKQSYAVGYSDGGCREKGSIGGWGVVIDYCDGKDFHHMELSACLGGGCTNNIAEFTAGLEFVQQAAAMGIKRADLRTDSQLMCNYYYDKVAKDNVVLVRLLNRIKTVAQAGGIQLDMEWIKGHARCEGNNRADHLATNAIRHGSARMVYGPRRTKEFSIPRRHPTRMAPAAGQRYQTFAPFHAIDPEERTARTAVDLVDDRGMVLHICPLCVPGEALCYQDRRALLVHMRHDHRGGGPVAAEVRQLLKIDSCPHCKGYYASSGLAAHVMAQSCQPLQAAPLSGAAAAGRLAGQMVQSYLDFAEEVIGFMDNVQYSDIFAPVAMPRPSVIKVHVQSQSLYALCIAVATEGVVACSKDDQLDGRIGQAWLKLLLLLPRLLLFKGDGVVKRARMFLQGTQEAMAELFRMADIQGGRRESRLRHVVRPEVVKRKASELVQSYEYSRALRLLQRTPLAEANQDTVRGLHALHPRATAEHRIPDGVDTRTRDLGPGEPHFTMDDLKRVIKDLSPHASPDCTGHRAGHVQAIFRGRREMGSPQRRAQDAILELLYQLIREPDRVGDNEFWVYFTGAKLATIPRPVGSQNLFFKLISAVLDRKSSAQFHELAGACHLGHTPSGVMAAALMAQMELDYAASVPEEPRVILKTDASKAFQHASRGNIYRVLTQHDTLKATFAPWYAHTQRLTQRMVYPSTTMDTAIIEASGGITQGSISGTKLFCVGTAALVSGLQATGGGTSVVTAITDDITLHGSAAEVERMEAAREELQRAPNYLVNEDKQSIYTVHEQHVAELRQRFPQHEVLVVGGKIGFTLGGAPLGGDDYIKDALQENLEETKRAIEAIFKLESKQEQLLLLRSCITGRIVHLLGAVPPGISKDFAIQHDHTVYCALARILDIPGGVFTLREYWQVQRRLSDHGFGFRSMAESREFLFISNFARCIKLLMARFPQAGKVFEHTIEGDAGYGAELRLALDSLHAQAERSAKLKALLPGTVAELANGFEWKHKSIQRCLDDLVVCSHESLYDLTTRNGQREKALMLAADMSLFHICPRDASLRLKDEELVYAAHQALGKMRRRQRAQCGNVDRGGGLCGENLDPYDVHIVTCRASACSHGRHSGIQAWLESMAKQARLKTQPAPDVKHQGSGQGSVKRADIMIVGASLRTNSEIDGGACVVDVSNITPAADSYVAHAAGDGNYALELVEKKKNEKYAEAYYKDTQAHFLPFVTATGGRLGGQGRVLLGRLSDIISRYTGQERSTIQYLWGARLLVQLAKYQYNSVLIHAEAHSRRQDPWGDQSSRELELCENIPGHEKRILRD